MKITVAALEKKGFVLIHKLPHQDLIPFVKTYIGKKNPYTRFYYGFTLVGFIALAAWAGFILARDFLSLSDVFQYLSFGLAIPLLLLPLHEGLHGFAYKRVGAPRVAYKANWKQFYFMAVADQFVVNRRELNFVAVLPFALISFSCLLGLFFVPLGWQITLLTSMVLHAGMCGGDFSIMSYFYEHKHEEVVTYDDVPNGISYFYHRPINFT